MISSALKQHTFQNGIVLEFISRDDEFLGLGAVTAGKVALRSSRRPMFVEIHNPSGIFLQHYQLRESTATPTGITLTFTMDRQEGRRMEWMIHEVRHRLNTADWTDAPRSAEETRLILELRPVTREIGKDTYSGFSYRYHYHSDNIPIYSMLDRGTWELGGHALGNTIWMRNCFTPSIVPITHIDQYHATEWYVPDCANPNVFQFLPWQTELQGFSFTTDEQGTLVTWATEVAHIRSLIEKPRGKDEIVHWHEHCGDLQHTFSTAPVEVLFTPGHGDSVDLFNRYEAVKELVHDTLHMQLGMRRERVQPFGLIEEWGPADLDYYRTQGLPKLLNAGARMIYLGNHFENNMNTWGVSNMCCTVDHRIAETVGEGPIQAFCREAQATGAQVEMWGNTAVSTLTHLLVPHLGPQNRIQFLPREGSILEALADAQDPWVRNPSNALEADHYSPSFSLLNLRDPAVRAYWLSRWRYVHDKLGLEGIFLDSSFNLSSDKFHYIQRQQATRNNGVTADQTALCGYYRPAVEPPAAIYSQYRAHLELMVEMQNLGYHYYNEDLGVFGVHRHGPYLDMRLDSLPIWSDCLSDFSPGGLREMGVDADAIYFRGLAYRMMWCIMWDPSTPDCLSFRYGGARSEDDIPTTWHLDLFQAYGQVEAHMRQRDILPEELGVRYRDGRHLVLWAFDDLILPLDGPHTITTFPDHTSEVATEISAHRHHIYLAEQR